MSSSSESVSFKLAPHQVKLHLNHRPASSSIYYLTAHIESADGKVQAILPGDKIDLNGQILKDDTPQEELKLAFQKVKAAVEANTLHGGASTNFLVMSIKP